MTQKMPINYALLLLKIRDRSTEEIRVRMRRKGFAESEITHTIDFLNDRKFLDDQKFAVNYLKSQINAKPQGKSRLYSKLKQVYLPNEVIKEVLGSIDSSEEQGLAQEAAERWLARHGSLPAKEIKSKISRYLAGRGFGWDTVSAAIEKFEKDQLDS